MPTHEEFAAFLADYRRLSPQQRAAFLEARDAFVEGLRRGAFRRSLRVKKMTGHDDIWELTWAPDGRATFAFGPSLREGEPHVIWRRIGTHDIFRDS